MTSSSWRASAAFTIFCRGQILIRTGEPIYSLYFITDGTFSVIGTDGGAIGTVAGGEVVGEMSFFGRRPPNVSVKAKTSARVLEVARAPITAKLDDDSAFAARFYRALGMSLSYRLRRASSKTASLTKTFASR